MVRGRPKERAELGKVREHQHPGPVPGGHEGYQKALSGEDLCYRKITLVANVKPELSAHT